MENPFVENLVIDVGAEVTDMSEYLKNKKKYDSISSVPTIRFERSSKTSVYTSVNVRRVISSFSGSAAILFLWIQQILKYGEDDFSFNGQKFMQETGMSRATLVKAKKELIDKQIIAKKDKKKYWINPVVLFKGSRVKKYPNSVFIYKSTKNITTSNSKVGD